MSNSEVIKMPKRFDYVANVTFNTLVDTALRRVRGDEKTIVLDCTDLDYLDSTGIGLLVMSYKKAQALATKIIMVNVKPSAKEILTLANLQKLIEIK